MVKWIKDKVKRYHAHRYETLLVEVRQAREDTVSLRGLALSYPEHPLYKWAYETHAIYLYYWEPTLERRRIKAGM